jgi:hypothetical protein
VGALLISFAGPQYRLLAALMWGPLCGAAHLINDWVKPRYILEDMLIADGLLSPQVAGALMLRAEGDGPTSSPSTYWASTRDIISKTLVPDQPTYAEAYASCMPVLRSTAV